MKDKLIIGFAVVCIAGCFLFFAVAFFLKPWNSATTDQAFWELFVASRSSEETCTLPTEAARIIHDFAGRGHLPPADILMSATVLELNVIILLAWILIVRTRSNMKQEAEQCCSTASSEGSPSEEP